MADIFYPAVFTPKRKCTCTIPIVSRTIWSALSLPNIIATKGAPNRGEDLVPSVYAYRDMLVIEGVQMNEEQKALIDAVVHEAAAPFTGVVADLVGVAGGDALKEFRRRKQERRENNERKTVEEAARLIDLRQVKPDPGASPENIEEILDAAKDCGYEEVRAMFARLLAAVCDSTRSNLYRREFVQIVGQLEPLDADLLPRLNVPTDFRPHRVGYFAIQLNRSQDEIENAIGHLAKLGLLTNPSGFSSSAPQLSALGRQLLGVVS